MGTADEWTWDTKGVRVSGDRLLWFDHSGSLSQPIGNFLSDGAPVPGAPALVLDELRFTLPTHQRGRTRSIVWFAVVMALLAPLAVVLGFRLSFEACLILNPFGLPWPPLVKVPVRILCALIVIGSLAGLIYGFTRRDHRMTSLVVAIYSVIMIVPTFFALLATVYGDPGPNCVIG